MWIIPIVSLIMNGMVYATALGSEIGVDIVVRILMGIIFVMIGNYMPKCIQNHTIGIRVTWTLRNEENWNKTHRFAGKIWVVVGILLLASIFVPIKNAIYLYLLLGVILLVAFIPILYSYVYYRRQLKKRTEI